MTYAKITDFKKQNWLSSWQSVLLKWALLSGEQKFCNLWERGIIKNKLLLMWS